MTDAFQTITEQLGPPPYIIQADEKEAQEKSAAAAADAPKMVTKNVVLADGTYATQTVYSETKTPKLDHTPHLRKMIINGDVFLGSLVGSCLTKLCLRAEGVVDGIKLKKITVDSLLIMCAIVKMSEVTVSAQRSSLADCQERITMCCRALLDPKAREILKKTFLTDGKATYASFLKNLKDKEAKETKKDEEAVPSTQADD